jgi:hypothetical protein
MTVLSMSQTGAIVCGTAVLGMWELLPTGSSGRLS